MDPSHLHCATSANDEPYEVECTYAGVMSLDALRPYDEESLCAGILAYNAKAYSNADAYEYEEWNRLMHALSLKHMNAIN